MATNIEQTQKKATIPVYAIIDRENMARSGVYPKWLEAEHVKKLAGSGYATYGTKQESIEGALEELNDMIEKNAGNPSPDDQLAVSRVQGQQGPTPNSAQHNTHESTLS